MSEVKDLIVGMSDEDLLEAVEEKYSNYTLEALENAKEELERRNISFVDKSVYYSSNDKNAQEDILVSESPEEKAKRFEKDKKTVEIFFSFIFGVIYITGALAITYFQQKPIIDTIKTLLLLIAFVGVTCLVWKFTERDVVKKVILFSLSLFMFKVANNALVIHETHFDLGSAYSCGFAVVSVIEWYIKKKKLSLWKVIGLVMFFLVFIMIDYKFNK